MGIEIRDAFERVIPRLFDGVDEAVERVARQVDRDLDARAPAQVRHRIAEGTDPIDAGGGVWHVEMTSDDAFIWQFHEFGTRKMPARPFVGPAVLAGERELREQLSRLVRALS
ncbi:MAG: HK97-gp10 family putative phage morphogenesis protein [Actinomycetota bacterium]|nr:HK97-gp10 family putative phage morphogenesis protein [Actinomycetota bacterium]